MSTNLLNTPAFQKILFYGGLLITFLVSFYYYAPCLSWHFNSDQAVHVLMLKDFKWPEDAYYWGQNRLGSFLPIITWPFYKILPIHPLILMSCTHFLLLFFSWYFLVKHLTSKLSKFLLFFIIFIPHSSYVYIILIGHPYEAQLFCLSFALYFSSLLRNNLLLNDKLYNARTYIFTFLVSVFSLLAFWVSELSGIIYLYFLLYIVFDRALMKQLVLQFKTAKIKLSCYLFFTILINLRGLYLYKDLKSNFKEDELYDKAFITSSPDILKQWDNFYRQVKETLLFSNSDDFYANLFYYLLILLLILSVVKYKYYSSTNKALYLTSIFTLFVASIMLFLSSWNFRSDFTSKYYTILYVFVFIPIIIGLIHSSTRLRIGLITVVLANQLMIAYGNTFCKSYQKPFDRYSYAENLEEGVLVSNYWTCYITNSVSFENLYSYPNIDWEQRNRHKIEKINNHTVFYFFDDENLPKKSTKDTVQFSNFDLVYTGESYIFENSKLLKYRKL